MVPTAAIVVFIITFIVASIYYPGGSYFDRKAEGFSWLHNYWCNLMGKSALNGIKNPARPIAIAGAAILCAGVGYFYFLFPRYFKVNTTWKRLTEIFGIASMVFAVFLYSNYHDLTLTIAGVFGFGAMMGTLIALRRNNSPVMLTIGSICVALIAINNIIYYTDFLITLLPVIQKVTLLLVLLWLIGLNFVFLKSVK